MGLLQRISIVSNPLTFYIIIHLHTLAERQLLCVKMERHPMTVTIEVCLTDIKV